MTMTRRAILAFALIAGLAPAMAQIPPPVPALPDAERRTSYSITASTCSCNVNFALYGDSTDYANWLEVFVNGVLVPQSGNWTIASPTGPLATIPRPITDAVLTFSTVQTGTVQIVGARRPRRVSQFSESAGVSARNLNQVITDIVAMLREVWDKINDVTGRGVFAPPGETMKTLPPAANRANMGVCFDSGGNLVPCVGSSAGSFSPGTGITFAGTNPTTISTPAFTSILPGPGVVVTPSGTTVTIGLTTVRQTLPTHCAGFSGGVCPTSGSGTYTAPANVLWIEIDIVGGGAGGSGGNATNGTAGNPTCWNTSGAACTTPLYQAGGGAAAAAAAGGSGGTVSGTGTCDWSVPGGSGGSGIESSTITNTPGGVGGNTSLGGGGGTTLNSTGGNGATNSGAGGGGGGQNGTAATISGPGGGGGATCHVIINSPASTYTYAVGGTAAGGTGGSGGASGGIGAGGHLVVYEHYGS